MVIDIIVYGNKLNNFTWMKHFSQSVCCSKNLRSFLCRHGKWLLFLLWFYAGTRCLPEGERRRGIEYKFQLCLPSLVSQSIEHFDWKHAFNYNVLGEKTVNAFMHYLISSACCMIYNEWCCWNSHQVCMSSLDHPHLFLKWQKPRTIFTVQLLHTPRSL